MGGGLQTGISSAQKDRVPLGFGNLYASAGDHMKKCRYWFHF